MNKIAGPAPGQGRSGMNHERIERISELIQKRGRISLDELIERFPEVSSMTLRRDLLNLEESGVILRVRGGAISVRELSKKTEELFDKRHNQNVAAKKIIAQKAVKFIETEHSVFIDSGSTALYFVKELPDINYYVVTNGLSIAMELARRTMPSVTLIGGVLSSNNLATSGGMSKLFFEDINIDTAFLSATAFNEENGFSCGSQSESEIKKTVIAKAKKRIMLMDSSKVGKSMPFTFARLSDVDVLISDDGFPAELKAAAEELGISVI